MKDSSLNHNFSVNNLLAKGTVSDLISIAKSLKLKGYSGKNKDELIKMLHVQITNPDLLESLFLICDRRSWDCILASASTSSPTPVPDIALPPCKSLANLCILQCVEGESGNFIAMPVEIKEVFAQFASTGFIEQKEKSDLLNSYALAVTHLYGLIRQDEFVSIFNTQNDCKTNIDEMFSLLIQHISADAPYGFWGEYLTHSLFEENEYEDAEDLLAVQKGKETYIPERPILLQYEDPNFYEKSPSSRRLIDFLVKKLRCSVQSAEEITADFVFACTVDSTIGKALQLLDSYN